MLCLLSCPVHLTACSAVEGIRLYSGCRMGNDPWWFWNVVFLSALEDRGRDIYLIFYPSNCICHIFGTLIAFFCYLESLKHLEAAETSLLSCAEPLSAAFLAVIWLKVPFNIFEWIGAFFILTTILLLSLKRRSTERELAEKPI